MTENHDFIGYLNFFLQFAEPPYPAEVGIREQFERIGIRPGAPWDASKVDPQTLAAIDAGIADAKAAIKEELARTFSSNGLFGPRSLMGTNYLLRDVAANKGLYGNDLEEAWYGGYDSQGAKPQVIHFPAGQLPPAKFFWSMTLYTLPDRFPTTTRSIGTRLVIARRGWSTARTVRSTSMSAMPRPVRTRRRTGCRPRRASMPSWREFTDQTRG